MVRIILFRRTITTLGGMNPPESMNLFPLKMYSWFPPEILEDDRVGIPEALEYAVICGGAEWYKFQISPFPPLFACH